MGEGLGAGEQLRHSRGTTSHRPHAPARLALAAVAVGFVEAALVRADGVVVQVLDLDLRDGCERLVVEAADSGPSAPFASPTRCVGV